MVVATRTMDSRRARAVLGVRGKPDEATLRAAFRKAVKASHPDRPGGDAARLREVVEAYGLLKAAPVSQPPAPPPPAPVIADGIARPSPRPAAAPSPDWAMAAAWRSICRPACAPAIRSGPERPC
jgi:curved DNA-binding protein